MAKSRTSFPSYVTLALAALILLLASAASAQNSPSNDLLGATNRVVELAQQYRTAPASEKPALLQQLQQAAAQRSGLMASKIQNDPAAAIRATMDDAFARQMPAQIRGLLEHSTDQTGTLEIGYEDYAHSAVLRFYLHGPSGRTELRFAEHAPTELKTGDRIRVKGTQLNQTIAVAQLTSGTSTTSTSSAQSSPSTLSNTLGAQNIAVILVNFQDENIQPVTPAYVYGAVFGSSYSVNGYWLENSFQQTWATGNVFGWFTIPVSSSTCDIGSIASYGDQAAANAGANLSSYAHKLYIFPNNGCGWWGYSTIGGSPTQSWIRDFTNDTGGAQVMNLSHELGHALGLYHSHALNCGSVPYSSSGCSSIEYGDTFDYMGNANYISGGDYNAFQKERLGWLNSGSQPPIQTVTSSGTYTLAPYESQDSGVKALKILQSASSSSYYYVEYRTATGFDSYTSSPFGYAAESLSGPFVHLASAGDANGANLLNMNPGVTNWSAPGIAIGQSYTDPTAGVTITPLSLGSTAAVTVSLSSTPACSPANPTISASPVQSPSVASGTTVNYSITVTNNDNSACPASSFNLSAAAPSGWGYALSSTSIALNPGSSGTATLSVSSPSTAGSGYYSVNTTAVNSSKTSYSAADSVTYVDSGPSSTTTSTSPTTLALNTNQTTYSRQQTASLTAMLSGPSTLSGYAITFTITKSNGAVASVSATTDATGTATATYRIKKPDPSGVYTVTASGASVQATTSFTVQ